MSACTDVPEKRTVLRPSTVCFPCKHIELDDIHATDCGEAGVEVNNFNCLTNLFSLIEIVINRFARKDAKIQIVMFL